MVPTYANGAFALQMLGSTGQPVLQMVPTLTSYNVSGSTLQLFGSGLVEGNNASYQFAGATVTDTAPNSGPDVGSFSFDNGVVNIPEPVHGLGGVTVTTAGGTSAALAVNELKVSSTLSDVALDPSTGALWVVDVSANPTKISRIDAATGQVQSSITLTSAAFGTTSLSNLAGLQVVASAMTLNGTAVPAGSLLLFNGATNPDRVTAVNPTTGSGDRHADAGRRTTT